MFNEQRQKEILKVLEEQGRVSVEELSKSLKVSPSTIRRDLEEMEGEGLLRRTHGGAMKEKKESNETCYALLQPAHYSLPYSQL